MVSLSEIVAQMLREGGLRRVFSVPVGTSLCAEPIVVVSGAYVTDVDVSDGSHGYRTLKVLVVREVQAQAEKVAFDVRRVLLMSDWEAWADVGAYRICGQKVGHPFPCGRDESGRFVVGVEVSLGVSEDE